MVLRLFKDEGVALCLTRSGLIGNSVFVGHIIQIVWLGNTKPILGTIRELNNRTTITKLGPSFRFWHEFKIVWLRASQWPISIIIESLNMRAKDLRLLEKDGRKPMNTLKDQVIALLVLLRPNENRNDTLDRDACHKRLGLLLLHDQHGSKASRPIGYWSQTFNKQNGLLTQHTVIF